MCRYIYAPSPSKVVCVLSAFLCFLFVERERGEGEKNLLSLSRITRNLGPLSTNILKLILQEKVCLIPILNSMVWKTRIPRKPS